MPYTIDSATGTSNWVDPYQSTQNWANQYQNEQGSFDIPGQGTFGFAAPWESFQNFQPRDDVTPGAYRQEMFKGGGQVFDSPAGKLFLGNPSGTARDMTRPNGREWIGPVIQALLSAGAGAAATGVGASSMGGLEAAGLGGGGAAEIASLAGLEGFGGVGELAASVGGTGGAFGLDMLNSFDSGAMMEVLNRSSGGGLGSILSNIKGLPWNTIGKVGDIGSGIYGLLQSRRLEELARSQAAGADPFSVYRPMAGSKFGELLNNPGSITSMPGWEAGLKGVERSMLAQGYQGSGNMMQALQKQGGDFYNQQLMVLAQLAGAGINPANAGNMAMTGATSALNLQGNSLNRILASIMKLGAA